jgi:membrane dipeptidase
MNIRLAGLVTIVIVAATGCDGTANGGADGEPQTLADSGAREVLSRYPVFDGHNDLAWAIRRADRPLDVAAYDLYDRTPGHTDIARLKDGMVGAQFWSVYIPGEIADSGFARVQLEQVDVARQFIAMYPELELTETAEEVETAMASGQIASMLGLEGGHAIENSISALRIYFDLGVRYMTLTHNVTLDWADAASDEARHGGLTGFGEEVVGEMNRLGMLVDLSHVSPATMSDALDVSLAPVIFSHSSARALTDHVRNVPDSILARLPENGGVVMVTFVTSFVSEPLRSWYVAGDSIRRAARDRGASEADVDQTTAEFEADHPRPVATVSDVADHIEHVRAVAGIDHVGIGADYDGISSTPEGLEDVSAYPVLIAELLDRGWTDTELGQLTNGNILRVLRQAEEVAQRLKIEMAPSVSRLDDR